MGCLLGLGCLLLGSLWRLMLWFLRNVARNSPTCISNVEIAPLEFCGFPDTYEKLGYPNYVRVLVDEAPKANSCVRSSSHDTVHDPRDASNTTPTPHNAKSRKLVDHPQFRRVCGPVARMGAGAFGSPPDRLRHRRGRGRVGGHGTASGARARGVRPGPCAGRRREHSCMIVAVLSCNKRD